MSRALALLRVPTPAGRALVVVAVACWVLGSSTGWVELRVAAVAAAGSLLAAAAFTLGRSAYAVEVGLHSPRVVVGERSLGEVRVRSTARHRLLPAEVALPVGAGEARFPLPSLAAGEEHDEAFVVPTQRRGVLVVGPVSSVRGDVLGLLRRTVRWTEPHELFVHPLTVRLAGTASGLVHDLEGRDSADLSASDTSFHALRDYVPGDDRRHVHWRTSARTGALMVRQYEETRRAHLAVALDVAGAGYATEEEFELAVGVAASVALQGLREEQDVAVLAGEQRMSTGAGAARLLDQLAGVEVPADLAAEGPGGAVALGRRLARGVCGASVVVLVTGSRTTPHDLREATRWVPAGVTAVAVRAEVGGARSLRRLGQLTVVAVGALQELPTALRGAVPA